jgi:hypothetical protein
VIGSSVVFEALLALVTGVAVMWLWRVGLRGCAIGLSLVGLAAALGALLFAGVTAVDAPHAAITRWAAVGGFPAFAGFALWRRFHAEPRWPMTLLIIALLIGLGYWLSAAIYPLVIGTVGLLGLLLVALTLLRSAPSSAAAVLTGCALTALAGLLIGTEGRWGPLPRVDCYHLALSVANIAFGWSLSRSIGRDSRA